MHPPKRYIWIKLLLGAAMVLVASALVSSCCGTDEKEGGYKCELTSPGEDVTSSGDAFGAPDVLAPKPARSPLAAVSGPTCPAVNFLQASFAIAADVSYTSGLQRQSDGSFTRWRYNTFAPYSFLDSTPQYQPAFGNCSAAGARTFKNPPGWMPLAGRPGAMSQALVFANLLGNGTPVGLAIAPASFDGGPSASSLMVAIPNPDGTTKSVNFYAVSSVPWSILTGDFNHDGKEDVVVISFTGNNSNGIAVYLGNGDGTLQAPKFSSGHQATIYAVAYDFNGDGNLDLAVLNGQSSDVSILLGNGDGTFATAVNYPAVSGSIVAGDFNGDGHVDLAVSGSNSVVVLPGNGNGTFGAAIRTPLLTGFANMAAGDFNHDGKLDLAGSEPDGETVSVLLGDGTGKFPTEYDYLAGSAPTNLYAMDLDGDGNLDVVIASGHPDLLMPNENVRAITAFFGRGDGTLIGPPEYLTGAGINATAVADFNGDGKPDIAVTSGGLWVLVSSGGGNFKTPVQVNLGSGVTANGVAAADLDGDGNQDLVVGDFNGSGVYVLLGNGNGTFKAPVQYSVGGGTVTSVAVADFNGDGKPDIAFSGAGYIPPTGSTAGILIGNGGGTFQAASNLSGFGTAPVALAVADFNNDGKPDLAIVDQGYSTNSIPGGLVVYINKGNGGFQTPANYSVGINPVSLTTAGGNLMVVTEDPNFKTNSQYDVAVLVGNGNGTFKPASFVATAANPTSIAAADLNGDGKPDLAIAHCCTFTYMTYMLGNGDGTFQPEVVLQTTVAASTIAAADLNGDGKPDLIAGIGLRAGYVSIFLNLGAAGGVAVPTLGVSSTHIGSFLQGQSSASYILSVQNSGAAATSGAVSVADTLPAPLTATAINGPGWACTLATLTCSRSDALAAGGTYPPITLTVSVASNAASPVTNQVSASGGGAAMAAASDPTTILAPFSDVNPSDAFLPAIDLMREYAITSGCGANPPTYCPDANITREQMAVFVVRAIMGGDNFTYTLTPYFSDVPSTDPLFAWVQKMRDLGITSGCSPTTYCPNDPVTRDQMAVFIIRARFGAAAAFTYPPAPSFTDVPASNAYFPWIQKMSQIGITSGCGTGIYCPTQTVTRGQMAVFIMRGAFNQLLPAGTPVVVWVSPGSISPGQSGQVTIAGQNTNFSSGVTQVTAGAGITVSNISVASGTTLTAQFAVASGASLGPRSIVVTTGSEEATLPNGFHVQ